MKYIQYTAAGIFVSVAAVTGYVSYQVPGDTQAGVLAAPQALSQKAEATPDLPVSVEQNLAAILSQGLDVNENNAEQDLPAGQSHVSGETIEAARSLLFVGKHKNNTNLFLQGNDNKLLVAKDAYEVKELLLSAGAEFFSLRQEDDVLITEATVDDLQNVYYTYQQTYKGVPVEGRYVIVQANADDKISLVTGQFETHLNVELDQLQDAKQSVKMVLSSLADTADFEPKIHTEPELRVYVDDKTSVPVAAYRSVVEYNDHEGINHLEELFVDAQQASLLKKYSLIHSALSREIYSTKYLYCIGTPGVPESYTLPGTYKFGESGPGYYNDSEEKSAYNNTGSSYWFYRKVFNRDSYNGSGVRLRSSVHSQFMTPQYTCSGNNAQYRPAPYDQLIFGTGDNGPGLSESLDVVGHELTHGVTYNTSALKYENETGAINEALSDIFGAGIEAWSESGGTQSVNPSKINTSSNTWIVCSQCESGLQRYMNNPTRDGNSKDYYPEKYSGTDDNGGVHLNSGIMNLAFYLLSEGGKHPRNKTSVAVTGIGIDKALRIYYDANTTLFKTLTSTSNAFTSARSLLAQAAETRYGKCSTEWKSVHQSFQAVGVGSGVPACSSDPAPAPTQPDPLPADTNLALTATAYSSSYYRAGYEPQLVNDNNAETQWRSRQIFSPYQTEYVALDFGKQVSFNQLEIDWAGSDYPQYFYIQALDSSNYWRTIKTVRKSSSGSTTINVSANTRVIRVVMKYGAYYRWFAIKELKVN